MNSVFLCKFEPCIRNIKMSTFIEELHYTQRDLIPIDKKYGSCDTDDLGLTEKEYSIKYIHITQKSRVMNFIEIQNDDIIRIILIGAYIRFGIRNNVENAIIQKYPDDVKWLHEKKVISLSVDMIENSCISKFMKMTNALSFDGFIKVLKLSIMNKCDKVKCIRDFIKDNNIPSNIENGIKDIPGIEKLYHDGTLTLTDNATILYRDDTLAKIINY